MNSDSSLFVNRLFPEKIAVFKTLKRLIKKVDVFFDVFFNGPFPQPFSKISE